MPAGYSNRGRNETGDSQIVVGAVPLLSQEGWREAPGWFQSETLLYCGFGTTPRVIASQSRCPPNLGGQYDSASIRLCLAPISMNSGDIKLVIESDDTKEGP